MHGRALWTLPVTSCSCTVPRPFVDGTIRQGYTPSCRIPNHTCSHDVTLRIAKTNLAVRGVPHTSTCALLVRTLRRALCEQNTPRRPRRVSHTCPRREAVQSKSSYPAWPLSVRGISYIHRWHSRTGLHSRSRARGGLVRCTAWHGPHARCCANPVRSPMKL